jgi:DNA-binding response OmpR family regulator
MGRIIKENRLSALMVGKYEDDRLLVQEVFKEQGWRLFEALDRTPAMQGLKRNRVQVVIADTGVPNWSWQRILDDLRGLAKPPQLIVASRTADEWLWAEVLNTGGYDVMARPFDRYEVERVISAAYRHFDHPPLRAAGQPG